MYECESFSWGGGRYQNYVSKCSMLIVNSQTLQQYLCLECGEATASL
jgi:hypothetical protein